MRFGAFLSRGIVILFAVTMFVSATLLFEIQPMFAKQLLPLVGGAPAVWNTVVVFFQVALIGGYLLAHLQRTFVPLKWQTVTHLALAVVAIAVLPFRVLVANAGAIEHPVPFILLTLLTGAGLPFLVIAATAPLLQSWFARLGHARSEDPYFFYAVSNVGSLLGLAAYPLFLEPLFGLHVQSRLWEAAYVVLVIGLAACGVVTWRYGTGPDTQMETLETAGAPVEPPGWPLRLRWTALAFVPASLSLAMTTHITNEVAPIPLLWTLPLGVYLLTFIIAFARRPFPPPRLVARALPYVILPLALLVALGGVLPAMFDVAFNLLALFVIALTCHGELAASRPAAHYLTAFYLVMSVGGALGGFFNALVAPYVFHTVAEYPITLVLACALLPALGALGGSVRARVFDVVAPVLLAAGLLLLYTVTAHSGSLAFAAIRIVFSVAMIACFGFVGRRLRFALGLTVLFIVAEVLPSGLGDRIYVDRNFFGTKLVVANHYHLHLFIHSGTVHGIENSKPGKREVPLAYYSKEGPLRAIFAAARTGGGTQRVGVVGLGVGATACYHLPGEQWTFFEIDPQVVALAQNDKLFWYLSSCTPNAAIVVGDGRLELAKEPPGAYDLLVLDAYSSDQPPIHMLTSDAFKIFTARVAPRGFIAFHISNRYFNLVPVVSNLAASVGWKAWLDADSTLTPQRARLGEMESQWVVVARNEAQAGAITSDPHWRMLAPDPRLRTWTDDYSSLVLVMQAG